MPKSQGSCCKVVTGGSASHPTKVKHDGDFDLLGNRDQPVCGSCRLRVIATALGGGLNSGDLKSWESDTESRSDIGSRKVEGDRSEMLLIDDVVFRTKLSRRKLSYDLASGALPYVKFGRSTRFLATDVDAYIYARRIGRRDDKKQR